MSSKSKGSSSEEHERKTKKQKKDPEEAVCAGSAVKSDVFEVEENRVKECFYEVVKRKYKDEDFDLIEWFNTQSPEAKVSVLKGVVHMKVFNLDTLRNAVLVNVCRQNLKIEKPTILSLMEFLSLDFDNLNKRIYIQVLIHYSKFNVKEKYEEYLRSSPRVIIQPYQFYSSKIKLYCDKAMQDYDDQGTITQMPKERENFIIQKLMSPEVIAAFLKALSKVSIVKGKEEILKKLFLSLHIYQINGYLPLPIRGATLLDGFVISLKYLAEPRNGYQFLADLITVSIHECAHYLLQNLTNDFNFSSPLKNLTKNEGKRLDSTKRLLEFGREAELIVFSGIQPDWTSSSIDAAQEFLDRLKKGPNENLEEGQVLSEQDCKIFPILPRPRSSACFGIDPAINRWYFE